MLVVMIVFGLAGRSRGAAAQPGGTGNAIVIPAPPIMAEDFVPLTQHSIFFKGIFNPPAAPPRATVLVLHGCASTDGRLTALLEDTETNRRMLVHEGDAIAGGRIMAITLDYLEYQSQSGRRHHVSVGQNLTGGQIFGNNAGADADTLARPRAAIRQAEINGSK
jgi:hypothetical protein